MVKLQGKSIYLGTLEREDFRQLYKDFEYDFEGKTEPLNIGHSVESADEWYEKAKTEQGKSFVRLGIFKDETLLGSIGLQEIDWKNRSCSIGSSISKLADRSKGYGQEAVDLLLEYAFNNLGLERITANTLEHNYGAIKSLEKTGLIKEGVERKAVYFAGKKYDRYHYGLLREEYMTIRD